MHVVDDDESVRNALARLLRSAGLASRVHASAEDFLAAVDGAAHACVVLDVTMPRMNGLDLVGRLRARGIALPAIAVSARDDDETRRLARELGVSMFLRKPVDDQALLDAIAWVADKGRASPESRPTALSAG